jgi:uncharacterized membrane protein
MTNKEAISKLQDKLNDIPRLKTLNYENQDFNLWIETTKSLVAAIFSDSVDKKLEKFDFIFRPFIIALSGNSPADKVSAYNRTLDNAKVSILAMIEEIKLRESTINNAISPETKKNKKPLYKRMWAIICAIVVGTGILLGVIYTAIQIYESETVNGLLSHAKISKSATGEVIDTNNWETPLNIRTKKRIDDIYEKIRNEKLEPWLFIRIPDKGPQITDYNGKPIPKGINYSGSPQMFFWGEKFMPPIIEDAIKEVFDQTIEECRKNKLPPKRYLYETECLLHGFVGRIYSRMAEIEYKLRSKETSEKIILRNVALENQKMDELVERYYKAAILLGTNKNIESP